MLYNIYVFTGGVRGTRIPDSVPRRPIENKFGQSRKSENLSSSRMTEFPQIIAFYVNMGKNHMIKITLCIYFSLFSSL